MTELQRTLKPGTTVYTKVEHVSRSGMSRRISVYVVDKKTNDIWNISYSVAKALDWRLHSDGSIVVGGCGMDMGYHLVNSLSYAMHGHKSRGEGVAMSEAGRPFTPRRGHWRSGYSLIQRWL